MFRAMLAALFGIKDRKPGNRASPQSEKISRREYANDESIELDLYSDEDEKEECDWWKFRFPRNRPEGLSWRIAAHIVVAGTQHRREDVSIFGHDVEATKKQHALDRFPFSLFLEAEPTNRHDPNAIKVIGRSAVRPGDRHLGYLPRETAAALKKSELPAIEAVSYFERDNYSELKINILEPKPTKRSKSTPQS